MNDDKKASECAAALYRCPLALLIFHTRGTAVPGRHLLSPPASAPLHAPRYNIEGGSVLHLVLALRGGC